MSKTSKGHKASMVVLVAVAISLTTVGGTFRVIRQRGLVAAAPSAREKPDNAVEDIERNRDRYSEEGQRPHAIHVGSYVRAQRCGGCRNGGTGDEVHISLLLASKIFSTLHPTACSLRRRLKSWNELQSR